MANDKRTPALDDDSLRAVSGGTDASETTNYPKVPDRSGRGEKLDNGLDEPAFEWKPTENTSDPQSPSLPTPGTYELHGISWKP